MIDKPDYYQQFVTRADEFEQATLEQRKMIICRLIDEIKVGRGYEITVELNASYGQLFCCGPGNVMRNLYGGSG